MGMVGHLSQSQRVFSHPRHSKVFMRRDRDKGVMVPEVPKSSIEPLFLFTGVS